MTDASQERWSPDEVSLTLDGHRQYLVFDGETLDQIIKFEDKQLKKRRKFPLGFALPPVPVEHSCSCGEQCHG